MAKSRIPYSRKQLFAVGPQPTRTGRQLDEIAFPLGGIGTGSISLGGWGQLRDWEIQNRPAKGNVNPNAFFALRIEGRPQPMVRVIQGPAGGEFVGDGHTAPHGAGQGLPHFRRVSFKGEYPIATVRFRDPEVPVDVILEAFNPFIPLNDRDSGLPIAMFLYRLKNTSKRALTVTVLGNLTNVVGEEDGRTNEGRAHGLFLANSKLDPASPRFGSLALYTPLRATVWPNWHDGRIMKFWEAVAWAERFPPRKKGSCHTGTVFVTVRLKPGESKTVPFYVSWHFPNFEDWHKGECEGGQCSVTWENWYATQWRDAWDVARYADRNFDRLYAQTRLFRDTLLSSSLPTVALDAVSSQLSVLKTNTCLRLTDGTFYAFEGCNNTSGCCEGSCTHVWNYAQALPYLFPPLQRSMREADWNNSMMDDGYVTFRMPLPLGTKATPSFHPAADGQMGTVIQVYREWLISGDDEWLKMIWPKAKKALEFAWKYWDADKDGVMEGMQHNTYDMEFYGANTMMGSLYLGALRAAEEIARHLGEDAKAGEYHALFERGSAWSDENLFNGQYYEQRVNPRAHEVWPDTQRRLAERHGLDDKFRAWPKWQFGKGCLSDQLLGQWYAVMLGLGYLYDRKHVRKTLQSIFKHNWRADLSDHPCTLRVYAQNDEAGLLIATWPLGERPGYAFWFADEVWCGIEYQVASHLIYEGYVEEGLAIVKGVRDRHTGERRNPWDEFECGHHYARSLASYALLLALSGFSYSGPEQYLGFAPRVNERDFRAFFCVGSGWGQYAQKASSKGAEVSVAVKYGSLALRALGTSVDAKSVRSARLAGRKLAAGASPSREGTVVTFEEPLTINEGETLRIRFR